MGQLEFYTNGELCLSPAIGAVLMSTIVVATNAQLLKKKLK